MLEPGSSLISIVGQAFGVDSVHSIPVSNLVDRLRQWQEQPETLADWIEYQSSRRSLEVAGMGATAFAIHEGRISVEAALDDLQSPVPSAPGI